MTQVHVVIRRVSPALKVDLVQVGRFDDGKFEVLPFDVIESLPISCFLKRSDISDSFYINHSDVPALVSDGGCLPKFSLDFFDNTLVIMFDYNLNCDESASEEKGEGK